MRTKHLKMHLSNKVINSLKYLLCEILRELGYNEKLIAKGNFNNIINIALNIRIIKI